MPSSGMLRHVALVRTVVSEERTASIVKAKRISELGTTLAVTSNRNALQGITNYTRKEAIDRVTGERDGGGGGWCV
jgi:hypothetical protein